MRFGLFNSVAALTLLSGAAAYGVTPNLLVNPGFEQPITYDGAPFIGSWEGFNGSAGSFAANSTTTPRTGAMDLNLSITSANDFAGAFQDVPVVPGNLVTFSGYHFTPNSTFGLVVEYRIEWHNSVTNTEVSRSATTAVPTGTYAPFTITATAPAGADIARPVYDIESFGTPGTVGAVFADDMSLTIAPEPTSIATLAGLAGLATMRKRRA